jgi:hypothetical protein
MRGLLLFLAMVPDVAMPRSVLVLCFEDSDVLPLVDKPYVLTFSRSFVARHPQVAEQVWSAIAEVRESAPYRAEVARARDRRETVD